MAVAVTHVQFAAKQPWWLSREQQPETLNSSAWWRARTRASGLSLLSLAFATFGTAVCRFTGSYYPGDKVGGASSHSIGRWKTF